MRTAQNAAIGFRDTPGCDTLTKSEIEKRFCIEHEKEVKNGFVRERSPSVDFLGQKNRKCLDFQSNFHSLIVYNKNVLYYFT